MAEPIGPVFLCVVIFTLHLREIMIIGIKIIQEILQLFYNLDM